MSIYFGGIIEAHNARLLAVETKAVPQVNRGCFHKTDV